MEWIKAKDNKPPEGVPVWAILATHKTPVMMSYEYVSIDSNDKGWVWCMVEGQPFWNHEDNKWDCWGANFDDEYIVTHWLTLPDMTKFYK